MELTQSLIASTVREAVSDYYPTREGVFVGQLDDLADAVNERLAYLKIGTFTDEIRDVARDMMAIGMLISSAKECTNPENPERKVSVPYFTVDRNLALSPWYDTE
jgi:hypothetical protein